MTDLGIRRRRGQGTSRLLRRSPPIDATDAGRHTPPTNSAPLRRELTMLMHDRGALTSVRLYPAAT